MKKRHCETCGKVLKRKRHGSTLEKLRDFKKRRFCDRLCASRRNKPEGKVEKPAARAQAITPPRYKTALQVLIEIFNDENLDMNLRIQAARAALPYQARKATAGGKKEDAAERAQKASKGRFSAGSAPQKIVSLHRKEPTNDD